jgi:Putative Actinobacterial Holin-X, holin superfamily III
VHESSLPEAMSSADLVKELTDNASLLLKRQIRLATYEAKQELAKGKTMASFLGVAGLCAYAGVICGLVAAALAIGAALDGRWWAGALIVAGALLVVALVTGLIGYRRRVRDPLARTRAEVAKEISWAKSLRS